MMLAVVMQATELRITAAVVWITVRMIRCAGNGTGGGVGGVGGSVGGGSGDVWCSVMVPPQASWVVVDDPDGLQKLSHLASFRSEVTL